MRFPEFVPQAVNESRKNELESLRKELETTGTTPDRRNKILHRIIELEAAQAERVHGKLVSQEDMHFSGDSEPDFSHEANHVGEKDNIDLIEEKNQLDDAIQTYILALEEAKQRNPTDIEHIRKLNGMLRGSIGLSKLIETELKEREGEKEAA